MDLRFLKADIVDFFNKGHYEKQHEYAKELAVLAAQLGVQDIKNPGDHIYHKEAVEVFRKNIENCKDKEIDAIAYGDSILDIPKNQYTAVKSEMNFALSGSWAYHMKRMAEDLRPTFQKKKKKIKNVISGCYGGNPLLAGQPIQSVVSESIDALKFIHECHPESRFIVYGLPPVYNLNATSNALLFEMAMYEWLIKNHPNFVFIPMQKQFAGALGLFPTIKMSSDGVHLSRRGVVTLDKFFARGKTSLPWTVID